MKYFIITTQPTIYESFLKTGLVARAIAKKIIGIKIVNLYDFGKGVHKSIDDTPYGGGAGMVLRADIVDKALAKFTTNGKRLTTILLTPQGKKFDARMAEKLSKEKGLILISGRFEGYDERIRDLVDKEISIGDYVLTSGDLPAMVLVDAVSRQIPDFIEKSESLKEESFLSLRIGNCEIKNSLEYPQYTKPFEFKGKKVPEILLSGNHAKIAKWRREQSLKRTEKQRRTGS